MQLTVGLQLLRGCCREPKACLKPNRRTSVETAQFVVQAAVANRVVQVPLVQVSPESAVWPRRTGDVTRVHTVAIVLCVADV